MIKKICFDIDNTICRTPDNNYNKSIPIKKNIFVVNYLYEKGFIIKVFTSRYMGRSNENVKLVKKKYYKKTYNQLKSWNLKFHQLIMGKPSYDLLVDDKSIFYKKNWNKKLLKKLNLK